MTVKPTRVFEKTLAWMEYSIWQAILYKTLRGWSGASGPWMEYDTYSVSLECIIANVFYMAAYILNFSSTICRISGRKYLYNLHKLWVRSPSIPASPSLGLLHVLSALKKRYYTCQCVQGCREREIEWSTVVPAICDPSILQPIS